MVEIIINATSLGIIWGVLAIGVFFTFRILNIADLSCEGVFPLGAAIAARIISQDGDPIIACIAAIFAGALAGSVTGLLHTKLKIPILLSGILSMTALYSINLRVLGKANISLLRLETIYTMVEKVFSTGSRAATMIVGLLCVSLVILVIWWFLNTELGLSMRATGNNTQMIRAMGVDTDTMFMFGLIIGNALIGFAGALIAQKQSYADIGMGTGTIVIGLASVIIGEVLFGKSSVLHHIVSVLLGSVIYRIIISLILEIDFEIKIGSLTLPVSVEPTDLKLFTAILVAFALSLPVIKQKFASKKAAEISKTL